MKNIFVGNLSFNTSEEELRQMFEPHGQVDRVSIMTDRDTGRSRGFGFVEMANNEEGDKAITKSLGVLRLHARSGFAIAKRCSAARPGCHLKIAAQKADRSAECRLPCRRTVRAGLTLMLFGPPM